MGRCDQYVRNHLVEMQVIDKEKLEKVSEKGPRRTPIPKIETEDHVIERTLGASLVKISFSFKAFVIFLDD